VTHEINRLRYRKNLLFVNKKKQKNFVNWSAPAGRRCAPSDQKFFASFFQKSCFSLRFPDEAGFTLLELLVVLAIMAAIVGLVALRGTDRARLVRLPEAAQNLATGLRLARLHAITSGKNFTFAPPLEGSIGISGTKQAVFAPTGAATAAQFVVHDDNRAMEVTVDPLTGRVAVRNAP